MAFFSEKSQNRPAAIWPGPVARLPSVIRSIALVCSARCQIETFFEQKNLYF